MSRKTSSSMLSLKSPHNTQRSFANHTTLSSPHSSPSASLFENAHDLLQLSMERSAVRQT